jgi:hypothetical protein
MRIQYEGSQSEHVMPQRHQNSVNNLQTFTFQGHRISHVPGEGWKTSKGRKVSFVGSTKLMKQPKFSTEHQIELS